MLKPRTLTTGWHDLDSGGLDLADPVHACCHGSRLLGREPSFVLHGGGNTSVKHRWGDITGRAVDALYVKGSGWDLATIEPAGFAPLRLSRLHELLDLDRLSDTDMTRELAASKLDPAAPQPSVEALLHAFLPFPAVQHSHADAIVAMTNTADGEANCREIYGDDVVVIPYVMPGFDLAREVRKRWPEQADDNTVGMVLLNHGLFTFGPDTEAALAHHVELIERCEAWLRGRHTAPVAEPPPAVLAIDRLDVCRVRAEVSAAADRPMITTVHQGPDVAAFVGRDDWADLSQRGPLTPDHVLRTKRLPQVGRDVSAYVADYKRYFDDNQQRAREAGRGDLTMLDPAPRVVLDSEFGLITIGRTRAESDIVADIYHHTIDVITTVEDDLGGYVALDAADIFDCEYWDLEQAKLRRQGVPPPLAGQVAVVTGAASGIGRACAAELLTQGAAVVGLDLSATTETAFDRSDWLGLQVDVTDETAVDEALNEAVGAFGGVDIVIVCAGVFAASLPIGELDGETWRRTQAVNVDSVLTLFNQVHPLMQLSPVDGRVVVVGSKNVAAPGRGAAAYSASKAALTQLARVAALEWADDGIRVNIVHPDAVFDTGLWSDELVAKRAETYGMTPEEYKRRNLLRTEVTSATVALAVVSLCGPAFAATTGAQIPIDGGSDRVV
ncbi:MAG: bifunctional aldolase/short-chain dehydrogenase [Acidimicrobiia bacterium]|nr:bifunctional aldolase/short-chain dehydrogenase [Acidimicrobiia bacterium]